MFSHIASLYNLYVYFWRWALWKVFEAPNVNGTSSGLPGIVAYITANSYLAGPGFLGMREHMRRLCDEVWIIDLGGEGHGARREENVFAIQTPVSICLAVSFGDSDPTQPAPVRYARIRGTRREKTARLRGIKGFGDLAWQSVPDGWHDPFVPAASEAWGEFPLVTDLFPIHSPGTQVGRTWPVAIAPETAKARWASLAAASKQDKSRYFVDPRYGRKSTDRLRPGALPEPASDSRVADLTADAPEPPVVRFGFRSFDRQWLLADARLIALPRPPLWRAHSDHQFYLTTLTTQPLGRGPAAVVSADIPDRNFFSGRSGTVIPVYEEGGAGNVTVGVLDVIQASLRSDVSVEDLVAYVYALLGSPAYTERFWDELETPGPRVPITASTDLFAEAVEVGRRLIHVHTFGARLTGEGVPLGSARLLESIGPSVPESLAYDPVTEQLLMGSGVVGPVTREVWEYEVSGLQVVRSWCRYRLRDPAGRARSSDSPLDRIRPTEWTAQLDEELLSLLWLIEWSLTVHEQQTRLLETICDGPLVSASALPEPSESQRNPHRRRPKIPNQEELGFET
jgi:hypothetical protein